MKGFWIGLSDSGEEGKFVWQATGGLLSAGYSNWQLEQPDNSGAENCVHIGHQNRPGWNDYKCNLYIVNSTTQPLGGICELQP